MTIDPAQDDLTERDQPVQRTEHDVLAFYRWVDQNRPELLKRGLGDPYQQLKADLAGYVLNPVEQLTDEELAFYLALAEKGQAWPPVTKDARPRSQ